MKDDQLSIYYRNIQREILLFRVDYQKNLKSINYLTDNIHEETYINTHIYIYIYIYIYICLYIKHIFHLWKYYLPQYF
jgi:hypothetical protein